MIDHERALELAASSIDFELPTDEREALAGHLAACAGCRATCDRLAEDARRLADLPSVDAPAGLRERIAAAAAGSDLTQLSSGSVPAPGAATATRVIRFPSRLRRRAWLAAAAAVVVAVVGGTLAFQPRPDGGDVAVIEPSARPSDARPSGSDLPVLPASPFPSDGPVTAWQPMATLSADKSTRGVIDPGTSFHLASVGNIPAEQLAGRLRVDPPLTLASTVEADGRVRITPSEPLAAGAVYRFTLTGDDGQTLDSWAFQASQALRVIGTIPADTQTDVPTDTGIEVTFDQDGIEDAASHVTISPKVDGRFEQHGRTLVFVPTKLAPKTVYTVTVRNGVTVAATGATLEQDVRFRFETAAKAGSGRRPTTFGFTSDLYEAPTAERPTLGLESFFDWTGRSAPPKPPASLRIDVYRLPDQAAAIEAFRRIRASPTWSLWNGARVPTTGLTRVVRVDARLSVQGELLWTRLPKALPAGWYIVEHPSATAPTQAVLQVTNVSGYLIVSDRSTVVWANDLVSKAAIDGATVAVDGHRLGRTSADGTLVIDTSDTLDAEPGGICRTNCERVITVTDGGRSTFMPVTGGRDASGQPDGDRYRSWSDGNPTYWRLFHTDRTLYRTTDTIDVWGLVRERGTGRTPDKVSVHLRPRDDAGDGPPLARLDPTLQPTGAFSGAIELRDFAEGVYTLELTAADTVIAALYLTIGPILKPAYRFEVTTGHRVYVKGDRVRVDATATFYDGTPVPGVPIRLTGLLEGSATTDATGAAVLRGVATTREEQTDGPMYVVEEARPDRAEEGDIQGSSRWILVFPSHMMLDAGAELRGGRLRLTGSVHDVAIARLEAAMTAGAAEWDVDPKGAAVPGRQVMATVIEQIPIRRRVGTDYDFISKRAIPRYEYSYDEKRVDRQRLTTDGSGQFRASITVPTMDHDYVVRLSVTDREGLEATTSTYASGFEPAESAADGPRLELADGRSNEAAFGIGDKLELSMREPGRAAAANDRHLFYLAQAGIREVIVRPSARLTRSFPDWGPPNVQIGAVRFTGSGYVASPTFTARFRSEDRAINVELRSDKARYAPRESVTVSIVTRGASGTPLPVTVVLGAVDEKIYAIGGAEEIDPLGQLYAQLGDGIRATYGSHRPPSARCECGDTAGGGDGDRTDFRDNLLFRTITTDATGRGSVTFTLSDDLTSWRVSAWAVGAGLEAGNASLAIPVGLPFFVETSIAPQYLVSDRPTIQLRAFGSALTTEARVSFSVDSDSLGLHASGLAARAFSAVDVPLPALKPGTHAITITARTGTGAAARVDRLTRSFVVVRSRLTRTRTAYAEITDARHLKGGAGLTRVIVADAGSGRALPILVGAMGGDTARLEPALAAHVASSILASRFSDPSAAESSETPRFDGRAYQKTDGGIGILPYASSDLEVSTLAAIVAPDVFDRGALRSYFQRVIDDPKETRERRIHALAGLAGLGAPVLPQIRAAASDAQLTIRERLILGLGAAAIGDDEVARSIALRLAEQYGESVGDQARLRVGDDATDITAATAVMAMLAAATGDPLAPGYWAYVEANPSDEIMVALHGVGFAARMLERQPVQPARFAYELDGQRQIVDLEPGTAFHLTVTKDQLATLSVERLAGAIGASTSWLEPVKAASFEKDPDVKIERVVRPSGTIRSGDLVVVDLLVTFGRKAAAGCHRVTEYAPSGLVPMGPYSGWENEETGQAPINVTYPEERLGQRVVFCAFLGTKSRTTRLRYLARVITPGRYAWEPAIVESRSGPDRAALTPRREIVIR